MLSHKITIATPDALPEALEEIARIQLACGEPVEKSAENQEKYPYLPPQITKSAPVFRMRFFFITLI